MVQIQLLPILHIRSGQNQDLYRHRERRLPWDGYLESALISTSEGVLDLMHECAIAGTHVMTHTVQYSPVPDDPAQPP